MKHFFLALFIFAFYSISYGQNPVVDTHPGAQIYVIDPQSGQETPTNSDLAILFKNSLIDLVRNTYNARAVLSRVAGQDRNRSFTVTQMGVETNVNGFQITLDELQQNQQNINIYTFVYHVDNNTLYFYEPGLQTWQPERIAANNVFNLRKTASYAQKFTEELGNQQPGQNDQVAVDASVDLSQPVDADVSANIAPPAMPEYVQPECPTDGYLWQPGYWAYAPGRADYYWVPGAWVAPPRQGVLWTPPYWGYEGDRYIFHVGYWGDHIGFYGGINYGYGYSGRGYYGGEWNGGHFRYNTAVVRVNVTVVHNTYINRTVINNTVINNHNSFNGRGGVDVRPTSQEIVATREQHIKPTAEQNSNQLQARGNPSQFTKNNPGGKPANLATPKVQPFHPQNDGGNKGRPAGLGNNPNQHGVNPGGPINPAKPIAVPGKPGANPDKPVNVQPHPLVNPDKPANTPVKQVNPNKPANVQPNPLVNPDKPANTPVKQVNPDKPANVQPHPLVNPDKPATQTTKPVVAPVRPVANPGIPGTNTNKPKDKKPKDTKPKPKDKPKDQPVTQ